MPKKAAEKAYSCEIISEYDTAANEEVQDEIEIMQATFDNVNVSGKSNSRKKVNIPIVSQSNPARKVFLDITIVPGYPYLPPQVKLTFPGGLHPGDNNALSEHEVATIRKEVNENIQPCLSSGMPCLMQIASTVSNVVDNGCPDEIATSTPKGASSAGAATLGPAGKKGSPGATPTPGQSPALTPVPLKSKDALRLSLLTLHILRKCCHMKNLDSKEEANSDFEWLANYFLEALHVFPPAVRGALPWRGEPFARAFAPELQHAAQRQQQQQQPVHPAADVERTDLTKWLWESEELPLKLQQGTEGRYANEFIQQRLLGSGGFAPVYVCRKKIDGRLYAVKKVVMAEGQSEKIIREVQTLAALNHKNIVRYYDAWVEDGCEEELRQYLEDDEEDEEGEEREESTSSNNDDDDDDESSDTVSAARPPRKAAAFPCATAAKAPQAPSGQAHRQHRGCREIDGMMWHSSSSSSEDNDGDEDEEDEEDTYSESETSDSEDDSDSGPCGEKTGDDFRPRWDGHSPTREPGKKEAGRKARAYQTLYIQMELCSARSLRHLVEDGDSGGSGGVFGSENGEKVAAAILRQLLSVTAHTHRESIVHRDLKPDNVLFEMNSDYADGEIGTIRVADFGLARVMDGVKRNTSHVELSEAEVLKTAATGVGPTGNLGSVLYCAPEQEKGSNYDFKVDEFSIGMIALEMWLAIAGKGFRDRFTIMNEVWRSGKLPGWFVLWNRGMAEVIGGLLELDPQKRTSCEEVLSTANLPGDPADLVDALETIDRYGERIVPRVLQKMQKLSNQYSKPPPIMRDTAQLLASVASTDFSLSVSLVGVLHGSAQVSLYDQLILMNPSLSALGLESIIDSAGRNYCYPPWAQFAAASFLGMQPDITIGPFHAFYHKVRSFAVFVSPMKRSDVFNEALLEPVLSMLHLLALVDVTSRVELVISHADWLSTVFPKEVGDRSPPKGLLGLRAVMDTSEKVSLAVSNVGAALSEEGLSTSDERDDLVRRFASSVIEIIAFFGRAVASHVVVVLDPALEPSDTLVNRSCLDKGLFFECRVAGTHAGGGGGGGGAPSPTATSSLSSGGGVAVCPIAFGCAIDNFVPLCTVANTEIAGFCVAVDAQEFITCWKHFHMPGKEGIVLDGVAVKRHDQYSLSHLPNVAEAAVELWKGGVKAVLRTESDPHALVRTLKAKHLRYVLLDGRRIVGASSAQQNKMVSKQSDIPLNQLRQAVRSLAAEEKTNHAQQQAETEVVYLAGREDRRVTEEAREVFSAMENQVKGPVLVVQADAAEVERWLTELNNSTDPQGNSAPLLLWLKSNMSSLGIVPVFAARDSKMILYVNHKKFRPQRKSSTNTNNKKKK